MSLFELRSGRYFLTEAGEALHHYACKIDALMKEARRVTQEFKDFHKGAITIGASYVPATYLFARSRSSISMRISQYKK